MLRKGIFILAGFLPLFTCAQVADTIAQRFSKQVSATLLKEHLSVIASDAYEGRETGKKGQKMAADYIRHEFMKLKLKPGNDTSYFQTYPLVLRKPANIDFSIGSSTYTFKKDFYALAMPEFHDQVLEDSKVVFLGYGINDSSGHYNDYRKCPDLKSRIVVILNGEPFDKNGKSLVSGKNEPGVWSQAVLKKIKAARKAGARALLCISDEAPGEMKLNKYLTAERMSVPTDQPTSQEMPVFYISKEMASKLIGMDIETVKKKISEKRKPKNVVASIRLSIDIHRDEKGISGENVIGILEGSKKKDAYIFITAHYDHLGIINGEVYNGADDDGSGTVSVMALARAFCKARDEGKGPERSIVFMTVSGEEKGLLGSGWYVEHPTIPLNQIVCDLNIDMIGRIDEKHALNPAYVYIIGSDKLSSSLHKINEEANSIYTRLVLDYTYNDPKDPNRFYYRSDHYNFAKNRIPVIFYFNGTHADYHQETDEVSKIDFGLMEKRADLVFFTAWELSNRTERIVVDSDKK
jgi:hypothetical protein